MKRITKEQREVLGSVLRELGHVLREGVEDAAPGGDEEEQDLLFGERLELVHPCGRRVRDPVDPTLLLPGCGTREVVGEGVVVVRRDRQRG